MVTLRREYSVGTAQAAVRSVVQELHVLQAGYDPDPPRIDLRMKQELV